MSDNRRPEMMIIADDLTGALDAGVQLSRKGMKVIVYTEIPPSNVLLQCTADVISVDTETRHITPEDAYQKIYRLTENAIKSGIETIYKKTDSGLRGNVGIELEAVLNASGKKHLNFVPAYPAMERKTINGVHYVNGKPVAESIFSNDPIDPVKVSRVDDLIHLHSNVLAFDEKEKKDGIRIFDAQTQDDLVRISKRLKEEKDLYLCGGCAGFLETFPVKGISNTAIADLALPDRLLVFSGSVNDVTKKQITYAEEKGICKISISKRVLLEDEKWSHILNELCKHESEDLIIIDSLEDKTEDTEDTDAVMIAARLGKIARDIAIHEEDRTLMIIGGDTLLGFIKAMHVTDMVPIGEIFPGVVLAEYSITARPRYLITKSGGFGTEEQLMQIGQWLKRRKKEK